MAPLVVLLDNYDSFTFNLVQAIRALGARCEVQRHDALSVEQLAAIPMDGLLLGPGPCTPEQAGITLDAIRRLEGAVPMLGVCLGHQAIGHAYGAQVRRAERPLHGKTSPVLHKRDALFEGLPSPFDAGRYNSLLVAPDTVPPCLRVTAWTPSGEVMGLAHRKFPTQGVQFHPESILTSNGPRLLGNWLRGLGKAEQ